MMKGISFVFLTLLVFSVTSFPRDGECYITVFSDLDSFCIFSGTSPRFRKRVEMNVFVTK